MERIFKIVKKFLLSQEYVEDGFTYQFISVELDDDVIIDFTVNVILPKKGQSFTVEKFSYDIGNIMENISKYFGEKIVYMEHILVDGWPAPELGVYINPEDCNEIIRSLNENVKQVTLSNHRNVSYVESKISFRPQKRDKFYSTDSYQYINIYLDYNLSNISFNGEPVNIDMREVDEFANVFNEKLQDSEIFKEKLQNIIYRVLEPSLKVEDIEVYYNAQYWIDRVDGMEVNADGNNIEIDFSGDMFKKTS